MKKTLLVAGSCLALLTACGNKGVTLEGTWKEHQSYFNNKKEDVNHCLSEYEKVVFSDGNKVEMDGYTYDYTAEQKDDKTEITVVDDTTNETKHYEIKELKNGNIMMNEVDDIAGCELKKSE